MVQMVFSESLESIISIYQPKILSDLNLQKAAVLIPICEFNNGTGPVIVFTKRSESVQHHKGEISFPGGVHEENETLEETALRETREELGVSPFKILGRLNDFRTISNFLVASFVGYRRDCPQWTPNKEVAKVIHVPLVELLKEEYWEIKTYIHGEKEFPVHFFHWLGTSSSNPLEEEIIWGATANILRQLLALLRSSQETMAYLKSS